MNCPLLLLPASNSDYTDVLHCIQDERRSNKVLKPRNSSFLTLCIIMPVFCYALLTFYIDPNLDKRYPSAAEENKSRTCTVCVQSAISLARLWRGQSYCEGYGYGQGSIDQHQGCLHISTNCPFAIISHYESSLTGTVLICCSK